MRQLGRWLARAELRRPGWTWEKEVAWARREAAAWAGKALAYAKDVVLAAGAETVMESALLMDAVAWAKILVLEDVLEVIDKDLVERVLTMLVGRV